MTGGISDSDWKKILGVFTKHPNIEKGLLYGSRAKGNFQDGSDLDLALKGQSISSNQLTQIMLDYENLYLPWKLDLTLYETIANPALKEHIDRVGKRVF